MDELNGILKIIEYGHSKLSQESQIRALLIVDDEKLCQCLEHYEALEQFEICETLKTVIDVKKFNGRFNALLDQVVYIPAKDKES